jgi:hypothetical protein
MGVRPEIEIRYGKKNRTYNGSRAERVHAPYSAASADIGPWTLVFAALYAALQSSNGTKFRMYIVSLEKLPH